MNQFVRYLFESIGHMEFFEKKGMPEKGIAHVAAAFGYSMAGLGVLLREEAARLEVVMFLVATLLFAVSGAAFLNYAVMVAILLFVLALEAVNTAIELIIDRTSPERSDYAKQAKDLGSFAVFCGLTLFVGYVSWVMLSLWTELI
ncbi:MAG: diacylglycerol kinase [Pseudomonadota bacterium]